MVHAKILFLIVATIAVASVAADLHTVSGRLVVLSADADRMVLDVDQKAIATSNGVATLESKADSVLSTVDDAASSLRDASKKNAAYYSSMVLQANDIEHDSRDILAHLSRRTIPDVDHLLESTGQDVDIVTASAQVTLEAFGHSADMLTAQLADEHIRSFMLNMDEAAFHLNGTLEHVNNTVGYYDKRLTTPASFAKRAASFLVQLAVGAGQFARAFF